MYSDNVYNPFVDEFLTTKHPSLSSCFSSDSERCRDMSLTYHLHAKPTKSTLNPQTATYSYCCNPSSSFSLT